MRIREDTINEIYCQVIREDNLLHQSIYDPEHGNAKHPSAEEESTIQLRNEITCLYNGTSNQLWKETHIETKVEKIAYRFDQSLVNVTRVG